MKKLAIIGSGDLGQQIAYHARADQHYDVVGFFDDVHPKNVLRHGYPVLGRIDDVEELFRDKTFDVLMIGIGYKHLSFRMSLYAKLKGKIPFGTIIHSSSYVDCSARVGSGSIIYPGCTLDMNVTIADNVLLNVGCVIAHDTTIGESCFLSPGVNIAGFVRINNGVILGIGTTVIDNVEIETGVRTAGGAVVIDDLINPGLYVGIPAKYKKSI
jgi:sugar O-acyltransferase (sialic acid O-acetyltransferase NeuD family)